VQALLKKLYLPERFRALPPALPALALFLLGVVLTYRSADVRTINFNYDGLAGGSFLLTGVYDQCVTWRMPFFDIAASLALNLGVAPRVFFVLIYSGICALVFCAASLLRGYRAGLLALALAGLFGARRDILNHNIEQAFFSFLLLLLLCLLILRRRENTVQSSLLAGLAAGMTMLARSPLFLFPPALLLFEWLFCGERSRQFLLRALVFLAASYALLLPWGALNYSVFGKFSLADTRNAADNVITGAKGSVYTMEGDSRKLAGIGVDDSAVLYFLREAAGNPGTYALGVARRLWHIFLFYPALFGLFLAAFAAAGKPLRGAFALPAYFILIHSLFSIEKRYLYPVTFLALPLIAGALYPRRYDSAQEEFRGPSEKTVAALFWLSFCAALAADGLILAYPRRAAANREADKDLSAALARYPGDRAIQELGCRALQQGGDYTGFYECLGAYSKKFDDKIKAYFLEARVSLRPAAIALPRGYEMRCLIIRMLRELELGDSKADMASFAEAYAKYEGKSNTLGAEPYERDRQIQQLIRRDSDNFWDRYVYDALLLWPPRGIAKILAGMEKNTALSLKLRLLKYVADNMCQAGGTAACLARRDEIFTGLAHDSLRPRAAALARIAAKAGAGYPAAAAYLKMLSSRQAGGAYAMPLGEGVSEAELYKMLELRGADAGRALSLARAAALKDKRPLYYALQALFSLESAREDLLGESLERLEAGLGQAPAWLRCLSGLEAAAGNKELAGRLNLLAEKAVTPENAQDKERADSSRQLSDSAVEKMRAGSYEAAQQLIAAALEKDPENPEALMTQCSLYLLRQKKAEALAACRSVAGVVYSKPAFWTPAYQMLASEAGFEQYKLLKELGRKAEAREALRLAVEKAPAAWPGLAEAKKALKGL